MIARLERRRIEGELVPRGEIHEGLAIFAAVLRQAAETLCSQFGTEARQILADALEEAQASFLRRWPEQEPKEEKAADA